MVIIDRSIVKIDRYQDYHYHFDQISQISRFRYQYRDHTNRSAIINIIIINIDDNVIIDNVINIIKSKTTKLK